MLVLDDLRHLALDLGKAPGVLLLEYRCLAGLVGGKLLLAPIRYFHLPSFSGPWVQVGLLVHARSKHFWSEECQKWRPLSELVGFAPGEFAGWVGFKCWAVPAPSAKLVTGSPTNPLSSITNVPYGPAINSPIGVTALEMTPNEIHDSCLHHLHATLVWLRDGNWLYA